MSELREKCGIVGIVCPELEVSRYLFFGLFALQHRGQEASGIVTSHGKKLHAHVGSGLVAQVYREEDIANLKGHLGIGHNRYSTSGGSALEHAQPIVLNNSFALAHNGNLPSVMALEEFLKANNALQADRNDSELIADCIDFYLEKGETLEDAVAKVFPLISGSFSLVVMTRDKVACVRDSFGMRPLCLGKIDGGGIFASAGCALKTIGAEFVREVNPGELLVASQGGLQSIELAPPTPRHDIFE